MEHSDLFYIQRFVNKQEALECIKDAIDDSEFKDQVSGIKSGSTTRFVCVKYYNNNPGRITLKKEIDLALLTLTLTLEVEVEGEQDE